MAYSEQKNTNPITAARAKASPNQDRGDLNTRSSSSSSKDKNRSLYKQIPTTPMTQNSMRQTARFRTPQKNEHIIHPPVPTNKTHRAIRKDTTKTRCGKNNERPEHKLLIYKSPRRPHQATQPRKLLRPLPAMQTTDLDTVSTP